MRAYHEEKGFIKVPP